ncbi:hypothetical protein GCM10028775_00960 [Catellatospora paridis]
MRRIRQAFTATLIAAAAILPAAPAAAVTDYQWLSCPPGSTTGHISTAGIRYDTANARYVAELGGVLDLCRKPSPMIDIYGLARYGSGSATGLRYSFGTNPTQHYFFNAGLPIGPVDQAVCVVSDTKIRVACVSITWSTIDGSLRPDIQGALPIDDPVVSNEVYFPGWIPPHLGPGCASCAG